MMQKFEKMMSLVLNPLGNSPVYNCMVSIKDSKRGINFFRALGTLDADAKLLSPEYSFRTGSITKIFTAVVILQMVEEGVFNLDDIFFDLLNPDTKKTLSRLHQKDGIDYSENITLRHLLQHHSGLCDYFSDDERFLNFVIAHPFQSWNWMLVMEKYFEFGLNEKSIFIPGTGFHYSDTNYLLLAILIEQMSGKPLHQNYKERIFIPLNLTDTYIEFYENPEKPKPVVYPYFGAHSLEKVNTSFDWGAGGLISNMNELEIFIRSLFDGFFFKKKESLKHLIHIPALKGNHLNINVLSQYGLGIQRKDFPDFSMFGHTSAYGSMLFYDPEQDLSIILTLNQAAAVHKAEWLIKKIVYEIKQGAEPI